MIWFNRNKMQEVCERILLQTGHLRVKPLSQRTETLTEKCQCYSSVAITNNLVLIYHLIGYRLTGYLVNVARPVKPFEVN